MESSRCCIMCVQLAMGKKVFTWVGALESVLYYVEVSCIPYLRLYCIYTYMDKLVEVSHFSGIK